MAMLRKMMRSSAAATLLLAGLASGAQAFSGAGSGSGTGIGGGGRFPLRLTGTVVCTSCSLDEARKTQPNTHHLYQFSHKNGQMVVEVKMVNNSNRWGALTWPPRLWVRAEDKVFQQLTTDQNVAKDVEIRGILSNSRTLDVFEVDVRG
jgi:hypothetical protein